MLDLVLGTFMEWVGEGPFRNKGLIVKTLWYLVLFGPRVWDFVNWGDLVEKVGNFILIDHVSNQI